MSKETNKYFINGLRDGNEKVIRLIYQEMFPKVKHFILKNNGTHQETEEVFQDALFQLTKRLRVSDIVITSTFEGYFFTTCKNLWRRELIRKKKWVRNESYFKQEKESCAESEAILREEQWNLFEEKLEELSDNCRELLRDYFKKIPYNDIVKKFKYSSENVAFQRMFKCKKKLKDLIKKDARFKKLS